MRALSLALLIFLIGCDQQKQDTVASVKTEVGAPQTYFIYIKIPEQIMPIDRGSKYEDPVNDMLIRNNLGKVTGGGTMMTKDNKIEFVGVDVDVYDPDKSIPLIIEKLKAIGAPRGTVIEQYEPVKRKIKVY